MPEMILLVGFPGSGKHMFTNYLQSTRNDFYQVSLRDIYKMVDYKYQDDNLHKYLYYEDTLIESILRAGSNLIIGDAHMSSNLRRHRISVSRQIIPHLSVTVYQMARSFTECVLENDKRPDYDSEGFPYRVSIDEMHALRGAFEPPQLTEGIHSIKGVHWIDTDPYPVGNQMCDLRPEIFEIASEHPKIISDRRKKLR